MHLLLLLHRVAEAQNQLMGLRAGWVQRDRALDGLQRQQHPPSPQVHLRMHATGFATFVLV